VRVRLCMCRCMYVCVSLYVCTGMCTYTSSRTRVCEQESALTLSLSPTHTHTHCVISLSRYLVHANLLYRPLASKTADNMKCSHSLSHPHPHHTHTHTLCHLPLTLSSTCACIQQASGFKTADNIKWNGGPWQIIGQDSQTLMAIIQPGQVRVCVCVLVGICDLCGGMVGFERVCCVHTLRV